VRVRVRGDDISSERRERGGRKRGKSERERGGSKREILIEL
jgi:hypothetical protein